MASKKDFAGMNTGRVYGAIEQATSRKGQQGTASPQEAATRAASLKTQGRKGCILTCKDRLVHYYASLGYASEGVSASVHGGAVWYDMRLTF